MTTQKAEQTPHTPTPDKAAGLAKFLHEEADVIWALATNEKDKMHARRLLDASYIVAAYPAHAQLVAENERLKRDKDRLDWLEQNCRQLVHSSTPDMGGKDWTICPHNVPIPSGYIRARSPRQAIDAAISSAHAQEKKTV